MPKTMKRQEFTSRWEETSCRLRANAASCPNNIPFSSTSLLSHSGWAWRRTMWKLACHLEAYKITMKVWVKLSSRTSLDLMASASPCAPQILRFYSETRLFLIYIILRVQELWLQGSKGSCAAVSYTPLLQSTLLQWSWIFSEFK